MRLLMLTSVGGQGEPAEARRAGVAAYLTKPVRQTQLLDCLVSLMDARRARRAARASAAARLEAFDRADAAHPRGRTTTSVNRA